MFKRLLRDKKGLAEIVGSLIIILIVVAAGVVVYSYSTGVIGSSSSNLNLQATTNEQQAQERFEIIRVWSNIKSQLNLTILNYGQIDLTIWSVFINGTIANVKPLTIGVGQLGNVLLTSPLKFQPGSDLSILAVSERGGKTSIVYQA